MINNISYLFLLFIIYSIIGYICEIIYSSYNQKKLVNRGFLCGPYCPIYGIGSLFILFCLLRFKDNPVYIFVLGAIITSCLEYFTSFILEKIFHNKWWDYSNYPCNINGRIRLQNALLFGFGSIAVIYIGEPITNKLLSLLSINTRVVLAIIIFFIFIIDLIYSVIVAYNLRNRIIICEELKNEKLAKIPGLLEKKIKSRVSKFKLYPKRLLEAFPKLKIANDKEFAIMKKIKDYRRKEIKKKKR